MPGPPCLRPSQVVEQQPHGAMAPKRKGEPVTKPKKSGRGRPPKASQAVTAAAASDEEAEQEEPEQSLDVVAKVCAQVCGKHSFPRRRGDWQGLSLLIVLRPKTVCSAVCGMQSSLWRECLHHAHL